MDARIRDLLKPEILSSVNGLELLARIIVEGFMNGTNKSQTIGVGQEFSQYRNYETGDDLRQLDWKMYARSERYFIKQADIETNITVKFMIDASRSMAYEEGGLSKLQYAKIVTAALGYLARKQGDTFGLFVVNNKHVAAIHPRFEQQQFMRFLHALVAAKAESTWKTGGMERLFDRHGKEMIIFITDLYDRGGDLLHFVGGLKTPRNEVIVFHLLGEKEMNLDWEGSFTFKDLETLATVKVDTRLQKKEYQERVRHWISISRMALLEKSISYHAISMGKDIDQTLRAFLQLRKKFRP